MNTELTEFHKTYIYDKYPEVFRIHNCIREYRNVLKTQCALLYLFIGKYKNEDIKSVSNFAKGLERDIDAVENAVVYDYSNGFVEGTNSRLKMIKGKCMDDVERSFWKQNCAI